MDYEEIDMNIQIYSKKKCFETQKAERYFKERKIKYQLIDLLKYGLSKGEFDSVKAAVGLDNLIDKESSEYRALSMDKLRTATVLADVAQKNPKVYHTPIVRNGRQATVGYQPDVWKTWE